MPLELSFRKPSTFLITATGAVNYAEAVDIIDAVLADARFADAKALVTDAREITEVPATTELRHLANQLKTVHERGLRLHVIVTKGGFVYGIARMFSVLAEMRGIKVHVAQSMEEAQKWLDGADVA
jgi:hypothetical protein